MGMKGLTLLINGHSSDVTGRQWDYCDCRLCVWEQKMIPAESHHALQYITVQCIILQTLTVGKNVINWFNMVFNLYLKIILRNCRIVVNTVCVFHFN